MGEKYYFLTRLLAVLEIRKDTVLVVSGVANSLYAWR